MDFPNLLQQLLHDLSDPTSSLSGIGQWNADVETFLAVPSSSVGKHGTDATSEAIISEVSYELHRGIISSILQRLIPSEDVEKETKCATDIYHQTQTSFLPQNLFELIRAAKNLLRWHIQIFLQCKGMATVPSPISTLQSSSLLKLLVCILEHQSLKEETLNQELCRNISLYLFYATYIAFPGDEPTQNALQYVMVVLQFPELALRILTRSCSPSLALALIRNLHNAIITLQGASKIILAIKIDWDPTSTPFSDPAPWCPSSAIVVDFQSTCVKVLLWVMSSDPPFPGNEDDKRGELASEILGALYAIRAGHHLAPGSRYDDLTEVVVNILQLPMINDNRVTQCKLSTISLLMDADPSFGEHLLQTNSFPCLLDLLDLQVSEILTNNRVDDSATAALVPVLIVLNKYATANSEIRAQIKIFVFPADAEESFRKKALEQIERESSATDKQKKNMGPLDAPEGTLRRNICRLLTWPEGHIKRCTGELLWTLSSSNPTEFVHRVGFGNALPLLSVKGFAKMPFAQV